MEKEIDTKQLDEILAKYAGKDGVLIPIMQDVQNLYNYLPKGALEYVSQKIGVPLSEIYGVATFYSISRIVGIIPSTLLGYSFSNSKSDIPNGWLLDSSAY